MKPGKNLQESIQGFFLGQPTLSSGRNPWQRFPLVDGTVRQSLSEDVYHQVEYFIPGVRYVPNDTYLILFALIGGVKDEAR